MKAVGLGQRHHSLFRCEPISFFAVDFIAVAVMEQIGGKAQACQQRPFKTAQSGNVVGLATDGFHGFRQNIIKLGQRVFADGQLQHQLVHIQSAEQSPALRLRPTAYPFGAMQSLQLLRAIPRRAHRHKRHQHAAQFALPFACASGQQSHPPITTAESLHPQAALAPRGGSKQKDRFVVDAVWLRHKGLER